MSTSKKILCIDLGTGNSCMAVYEGGKATVIPNAEGERTTPSVVAWTKTGERLVGRPAKRQATTNPKNTVYEVKRLIGHKFSEVVEDVKKFPFEVVEAPNGDCRIKVGDKLYSPEEISSFVLAKLKADAEAYLGEKIEKAIITVPAYFTDQQRTSTKDAGRIAGLEVLRIINEPTASCLAYGVDKEKSGYVAVADIGEGTSDFSILEIGDGVFEVKSTSGDSQLGGKDWDAAIMDWIVSEFKKTEGIDLSKDSMAMQRIKDEAEKAKIELSTVPSYDINLPFITADASGPKHLQMTLSRAMFEKLSEHLCDRLMAPAKRAIEDANVKIDEVILVGGSTRMPSIQAKIEDIFGMKPNKNVDPDLVVAEGAAIQGGVLAGEVNDIVLLDVTPLDIGIETLGGINTIIIPRGTTIPTKKSEIFSTAVDLQPAITVSIGQGNRKMFADNKLLGQFNLDGIPPAPRGVPQEEITIDIDSNSIITVTAKDLGTGKDAHITISSSSGLSKEEIERARKDAELHEAEDKEKSELISAKNSAESICFQIEKQLKDNADKVSDIKDEIEKKIADVREAIKSDSKAKIDEAVKSLQDVAVKIGEKIYAGAGNAGGATPNFSQADLEKMMKEHPEMFGKNGPFGGFAGQTNAENNASNKDDVVDADFEVKS